MRTKNDVEILSATLLDEDGELIAYVNRDTFFDHDGEPIAYFDPDGRNVYSYSDWQWAYVRNDDDTLSGHDRTLRLVDVVRPLPPPTDVDADVWSSRTAMAQTIKGLDLVMQRRQHTRTLARRK